MAELFLAQYDFHNCVSVCISSSTYDPSPRFLFVPFDGNPYDVEWWCKYIEASFSSFHFNLRSTPNISSVADLCDIAIYERNRIYKDVKNIGELWKVMIVTRNTDSQGPQSPEYCCIPVLKGGKGYDLGSFGEQSEKTAYAKRVLDAKYQGYCLDIFESKAIRAEAAIDDLYI